MGETGDSFIAYFDLLGVRAMADVSFELYNSNIKTLHYKFNQILSGHNQIGTYSFSDCAYLCSNNLNELIDVISKLREALFYKKIFFNAAVTSGDLGATIVNKKDNQISAYFESSNTAKVFSMQTKFTGVGIYLDPKIIADNSDIVVHSAFCSNLNLNNFEFNFIPYLDVKYSNVSTELIKYIINTYIYTIVLNEKAARYYLSALCTCLRQLDFDKIIDEYVPAIYSCRKANDKLLRAYLPIDLMFVEAIYSSYESKEKSGDEGLYFVDDVNEHPPIQESLNRIINQSLLKRGVSNINSFSDNLISSASQYCLSQFIALNSVMDE